MAQSDLPDARESIQQALAIFDKFEILGRGLARLCYGLAVLPARKEHKTAETNRERAETCILKIANSFAPDEPLRTTFAHRTPVRRILLEKALNKAARQHGLGRVAAP